MPRKAAGLTAAGVKTKKSGRYGDGNGLYLLVRGPDAKSWIFRYRLPDPATGKHRIREMGLGSAVSVAGRDPAVTLAEARDKAADLFRKVAKGIDPQEEDKEQAAAEKAAADKAVIDATTFADAAEAYIAAHEASWRSARHRQQWRNTLDQYAIPIFGNKPVAAVDTKAVMQALDPIWREKTETASRLRGRIEVILDYAKTRGWREGENPARWRGHIANMLPARRKIAKPKHHAALPWREINAFMDALEHENGVAAMALRFAILTAARTGEVIGAMWSEIDLPQALWTVPGDRMKAEREHRVPLSDAALAVLQEAEKLRLDTDPATPVFPGQKEGKTLAPNALLEVLERMNRSDLTVHGFRSTFRDWCAEATNYPREVAEAALAHTVGNKVEAAYRRGDLMEKRRLLMADWAAFCAKPAPAGEVVPMRRAIVS